LEEDFKKEEAERSLFYQSYLSNGLNSSSTISYGSTSPVNQNVYYSTLQNHHIHHGPPKSTNTSPGTLPHNNSINHVILPQKAHNNNQIWWSNGMGTSSSSASSTSTHYGSSSSNTNIMLPSSSAHAIANNSTNLVYGQLNNINRKAHEF
jgi:hypothetical protein